MSSGITKLNGRFVYYHNETVSSAKIKIFKRKWLVTYHDEIEKSGHFSGCNLQSFLSAEVRSEI
jgi:hypothetical protein